MLMSATVPVFFGWGRGRYFAIIEAKYYWMK
jgi:hypothetical protein